MRNRLPTDLNPKLGRYDWREDLPALPSEIGAYKIRAPKHAINGEQVTNVTKFRRMEPGEILPGWAE